MLCNTHLKHVYGEKLDDAMVTACLLGDKSKCITLLQMGADPNVEDGQALYTSALEGYHEIVQALIQAGVHTQGRTWSLAMEIACMKGHDKVVTLMREKINSI